MAIEISNVVHAAANVVYNSDGTLFELRGSGFSAIAYDSTGRLTLTLEQALDPTQRVVLLTPSPASVAANAAGAATLVGPGTDTEIEIAVSTVTTAAADANTSFQVAILALPTYGSAPLTADVPD